MSDIRGEIRRGKAGKVILAEVEGRLKREQWQELVEALKGIEKKYPNVKIRVREFDEPTRTS